MLLLQAALGWTMEPGIVCRVESPGEVSARLHAPAEGEYRLSAYGDYVPSADILELRRDGEIQARVILQALDHSCTVHVSEAQCPALAGTWQVARRLATMAETGPPQENPWKGGQYPSHRYPQTITYGLPGGGSASASYEHAAHAPHPALPLVRQLWEDARTCAPQLGSARIRAERSARGL